MDKAILLECPVCAGNVSSAAKSCPHCGHPIKESVVTRQIKAVAEQAKTTATEVKNAVYEGVVENPQKTYRGYVISAVGHIVMTWVVALVIVLVFGSIGLTVVGSMALLTAGVVTGKMFPTRKHYEEDLEKALRDESSTQDSGSKTLQDTSETKETTCDICGRHGATHCATLKVERRKILDWSRKAIPVVVCDDCHRAIHSRPWRTFRLFLKSMIVWFLICVAATYVFAFAINMKENILFMAVVCGALTSVCLSVITIILCNANRGVVSYMDARQMRKLSADAWMIVDVEE